MTCTTCPICHEANCCAPACREALAPCPVCGERECGSEYCASTRRSRPAEHAHAADLAEYQAASFYPRIDEQAFHDAWSQFEGDAKTAVLALTRSDPQPLQRLLDRLAQFEERRVQGLFDRLRASVAEAEQAGRDLATTRR